MKKTLVEMPKRLHVDCACDHPVHAARFTLDDDGELTMDIRLTPLADTWYRRLWYVVRYVLTGSSERAGYAEVIFKRADFPVIVGMFARADKLQKKATEARAKQIVERERAAQTPAQKK